MADQLREATTIKAQVRAALTSVKTLLGQKTLPKALRDKLDALDAELKKNWKDLEKDVPEGEGEGEGETSDAGAGEDGQAAASKEAEVRESDMTYKASELLVRAAVQAKYGKDTYCYVADMTDSWVVYSVEAQDGSRGSFQAAYVIDQAGKVTMSDPIKVLPTTVYVPVTEAIAAAGRRGDQPLAEAADVAIANEIVPLIETAVRQDGTMKVKIIQPGWGSSGYYTADVLRRDGPKVFPKETKMFVDHPTRTEEAERPERSMRDLAAKLATDAVYDAKGPSGPGLYAEAFVLERWRPFIAEVAPHTGLSINAFGQAKMGEAEGRKGPIIQKLVASNSIDFVTKAGAGGQVVELFEAARGSLQMAAPSAAITPNQEGDMNEEEAKNLREANAQMAAQLARLQEREILREARDVVRDELTGIEMMDATRARLAESLVKNPPVKDGCLDTAAMRAQVKEAAQAEIAYLASVTGSGTIRSMGSTAVTTELSEEKLTESLASEFARMGLNAAAAQHAAQGR